MQRSSFKQRGQALYLCLGITALMTTGALGLSQRISLRLGQSRSYTQGLALQVWMQQAAMDVLLDGSPPEQSWPGSGELEIEYQQHVTEHDGLAARQAEITCRHNNRASLHLLRLSDNRIDVIIRDYKK